MQGPRQVERATRLGFTPYPGLAVTRVKLRAPFGLSPHVEIHLTNPTVNERARPMTSDTSPSWGGTPPQPASGPNVGTAQEHPLGSLTDSPRSSSLWYPLGAAAAAGGS